MSNNKLTAGAVGFVIALVLLTAGLTSLSGCKISEPAQKQLRVMTAANKGHMDDSDLPKEARLIAQDNFDSAWVLRQELLGDDLPAEVSDRITARSEKAE